MMANVTIVRVNDPKIPRAFLRPYYTQELRVWIAREIHLEVACWTSAMRIQLDLTEGWYRIKFPSKKAGVRLQAALFQPFRVGVRHSASIPNLV